jgi:hypothetical protein
MKSLRSTGQKAVGYMSSQPKVLEVVVIKDGITSLEERMELANQISREAIEQDVDKVEITFVEREVVSEVVPRSGKSDQ